MNQDALAGLSKGDLVVLVVAPSNIIGKQEALAEALTGQIDLLKQRVANLEAKLGQPPKTPDNSSVPPSRRQKPNRAERRAAKAGRAVPVSIGS